jgi:cell division transport system permease protein
MSVLARLTYFWRSALLGMRHSPFIHLVAISTLTIALFTAGLSRGAVRVIDGLRDALGGEVEVTVYLDEALSQADGEALAEALATKTSGQARWVSPKEALERLSRELGELSDALEGLPENPLTASIELQVPPALRGPEALATLAREVRVLPGVTAVDYGEAAVARLSAISRALRLGGGVAFLVVVLATVIITSATLQLAIYARREEIEIQKLVGATNRFVKTPFLLEGMLQGVFGASLAVLALWGFSVFAGPRLEGVFAFLLAEGRGLSLLDARTVAEVFGVGIALGLCGSFVAVGRFLRV